MKLTASKIVSRALARCDNGKRTPRDGRDDGGPTTGKARGSCKSNGESKDDFELHVAFFLFVLNTEYY